MRTVESKDKVTCPSIFEMDLATLFSNAEKCKKYFFVLILLLKTLEKLATRKLLDIVEKALITCFFSFDGQNFTTIAKSTHSHGKTLGLGNYKGRAITTGCNEDDWYGLIHPPGHIHCYLQTEILDMETMKWSVAAAYPYGT